jgi:hypothetical protein
MQVPTKIHQQQVVAEFNFKGIIMKSVLLTLVAAAAFSANFAHAATFDRGYSEAPEFINVSSSTLSRSAVQASAAGTMAARESTVIPTFKSTLSRAEVQKDFADAVKKGYKVTGELTASQLN